MQIIDTLNTTRNTLDTGIYGDRVIDTLNTTSYTLDYVVYTLERGLLYFVTRWVILD